MPEDVALAVGSAGTRFNVTPGNSYRILGMILRKGVLQYLVVNDFRIPDWNPAALFDEDETSIPTDWLFRYDSIESYALWGYPKLVSDESHYVGLTEGNDDDRLTFFQYLVQLEDHEKKEEEEI